MSCQGLSHWLHHLCYRLVVACSNFKTIDTCYHLTDIVICDTYLISTISDTVMLYVLRFTA
jgi:hypothetical protein